jgi:hypothetical protein
VSLGAKPLTDRRVSAVAPRRDGHDTFLEGVHERSVGRRFAEW